MDPTLDYYAVLGVMPEAEQIVIVAAYRALASHYHPDRWTGDIGEATRKMAEINAAYEVLRDPVRRGEYDNKRESGSRFTESDAAEQAFDTALKGLEERWSVAVEVFPDLKVARDRLAKTATRLAFAYVTELLESKQFNERHEIALAMEKSFLQLYFGTDEKIIQFVQTLISKGQREAVKAVNRYVEVLGSGVRAEVIIEKVKATFDIDGVLGAAKKRFVDAYYAGDPNQLAMAGFALLKPLGLEYQSSFSGIGVYKQNQLLHSFKKEAEFVQWLLATYFDGLKRN